MVAIAWLNNNCSIRPLSRAEFVGRLDNAITSRREWVLAVGDPNMFLLNPESPALLQNEALMHMVAACARVAGDQRLQLLAALYFRVNPHPYLFGRLVDPNCRFERPSVKYSWSAEDYPPWFLHAVAPTEYPLSAEALANMFSPDKYRTGGATHQLFALYLYRNHNGATPDLDRLIRRISVRIASEASIDFRVTDLYLQRIAFLLAAGQPDLVKRRWVERALAAQQPNGGWLYSWHGWQPKPYRFGFTEEISTCHPTVQGMWITYMSAGREDPRGGDFRAPQRLRIWFLLQKPNLSAAMRRVPIQRPFKLSRDRRSFEVAGQNFTIRCVAAVEFPVGFLIRTKRRAFQRDACEQPARTGIGQHFRVHHGVRLSACVAANWARRRCCLSANRELIR